MAQADSPRNRQDGPGFTLSSRYEIWEILGEGGTGTVHKAHDILLGRDVAIKILRPHDPASDLPSRRFFREAQALARLNHPNILTLYDHGQVGNLQYLVMELGGRDLSSILKSQGGPLPISEVISLALGICRAVEYAHSQGVIHRDLKPANVLVSESTRSASTSHQTGPPGVKVMDFGLAKMREVPAITGSFTTMGTAQYMSPEQAAGREADERSDLYSFGILLYELSTGLLPFDAGDFQSMLAQHLNLAPAPPSTHNPEIPQLLESLILSLMEKDAENRPATAGEVLAMLEVITSGEPRLLGSDVSDAAKVSAEAISQRNEANAPHNLAVEVFVGRQREMAELRSALDDALSGQGRLFMLVGEPGIGKTRTTQELASYAENRGANVLWGRNYEEEGTPPYWPWVQAVRSYIHQANEERLISEIGRGGSSIADVVPQMHDKITDLNPSPPMEPEAARFRLFDSITTFLKNAAQNQPLMLVLDDLHWADRPSLLLLEFLARELGDARLLLVGCYRDTDLSRQHPLAETLAQLSREPVFRRQVLRGLDQDEVGQFVEATIGAKISQEMTGALYTHTEGNPFFMTDVTRLLSESGELTAEHIGTSEGIRIPEGVREVIGRRLNRLSEQCNELLTTASIIGREFDFRLLNILNGETSEDQLLQAVKEAVSLRLIEEVPRQMDRYQFSHALIQQTLAEEVTTSLRVRLHARIAEGLEELYGDDAAFYAAELAHHFAEAQTSIGPDKLVRYSLLAGEQSLSSYAYEDALIHFERGLVTRHISLSGTEPAPDGESAALLAGLGRAVTGSRERQHRTQGVPFLTRAFDYYLGAGNSERAVAIAVDNEEAAGLIEKALEITPPDSHDAGRLMSRQARGLRADYEGAQWAVHGALAIAQQQQDLGLEMHTLMIGACLDFTYCRFEESLDRNRRAISLAGSGEQPGTESHARYDLVHVLYALGNLEEAAGHASAMVESAERSGSRTWQTLAMEANENVSSAKGDWQTARNFAQRGLEMSPREANLLGCHAMLEYQVGDFDAGGIYLEQLFENVRPSPSNLAAFTTNTVPTVAVAVAAYITGEMTRFDQVEAIAQSVLDSPSGFPAAQHAVRIGLALIAVQRGDATAAGNLYGSMEPLRGTMTPQGPFGPGLAADRVLGVLSQTLGNRDQAASHFEDSMAFCRKAGYQPELAWTCCDYADLRVGPGLKPAPTRPDQEKANGPGGRIASHLHRVGDAAIDGAGKRAAGTGSRPTGRWPCLPRKLN